MPETSRESLAELRRARERVTVTLVVIALGVSIGLFALPQGRKPADGPASRVRALPTDAAVLAREIWTRAGALGGARPRPKSEVIVELAHFGAPMAPAALGVLLGESTPPVERGRAPLEIGPQELADLLCSVLERLPSDAVLLAVEDALAANRMRDHELVALRALGASRHPRALGLWVEVASSVSVETLASERFQSAAARSFERLLDGPPEVRRAARSLAEDATGPALALMARALARRDDAGSLEIALALLGRSPMHDGGLLRALGSISRHSQAALEPFGAAKLRRFARGGETIARADALAALGGFADPESAWLLIEALDDPDELVRSAARAGLERLARLELGNDRAAWTAWWEREVAWTETRLGLLFNSLESADPGVVLPALAELGEHPHLRHMLARTAAEMLDDARPEVALAACRLAGALRSRAAAPALLIALGSGDDELRDAAWEALREITGRSLPRQERAWREVLALD